MKIRFIPAGTALLAAAIASLICLLRNFQVIYSLQVVLITLVIFSYIGFKAQKIIVSVMHEQKMQEEEEIRLAEWREAEKLRAMSEGENQDAEGDSNEEETRQNEE